MTSITVRPLKSDSATLTQNSDTVTVTGSVDCSQVRPGTLVQVGNARIVEALEGTAPDGSGNSAITLAVPWPDSNVTGKLIAWFTSEGMAQAQFWAYETIKNIPDFAGATGAGLLERDGNGDYQIITKGTAASANITTSTTDTTAGRLLKIADYGIGSNAVLISDWDLALNGGFYTSTLANGHSNSPDDALPGWVGIAGKLDDNNVFQMVWRAGAAQGVVEIYTRFGRNTGFSDWVTVYHSASLNTREFGGTADNDRQVTGQAFSTTELRFYLPILEQNPPTSATIAGTFTARVGGVGLTGLTPTARTDISSNRLLVLAVTGQSGLTPGQVAVLESESATSKITVNP